MGQATVHIVYLLSKVLEKFRRTVMLEIIAVHSKQSNSPDNSRLSSNSPDNSRIYRQTLQIIVAIQKKSWQVGARESAAKTFQIRSFFYKNVEQFAIKRQNRILFFQ